MSRTAGKVHVFGIQFQLDMIGTEIELTMLFSPQSYPHTITFTVPYLVPTHASQRYPTVPTSHQAPVFSIAKSGRVSAPSA